MSAFKSRLAWAGALACLATPAAADDAHAVLDRAIAAMGGRARLEALRSLKLDLRTVTYRIDDSEREPGPDWLTVGDGSEWRDEDHDAYRQDVTDASAQWTLRRIRLDDGHTVADASLWRGSWGWSAQRSVGDRLALAPERMLLTAGAASDLRRGADAVLFGVRQQVVEFTWKGFPARLYIDAGMHLPSRLEMVRGSRAERISVMLGDIAWRTDFLFWRRQPDGLTYPFQWNQFRDGRPYQTTVVTALQENAAPPAEGYAPPPEAKAALDGVIDYADRPIPAPAKGDLLQSIGENLWNIEGDWNVGVVRQPDGLVVIECPQSGDYSEKIIALLAARFPGVRIKTVVSTTDSLWHIAGLRPYVALGVPIYALDLNAPRLQALAARPRTQVPDALARHPRTAQIRAVSERTAIGDGPTRIELYPIRGHGDERMMMAFLPGQGLLYGSSNDLSAPPRRATFNLFELVDRTRALGLPVTTYMAIHTAPMPWPEVVRITTEQPSLTNQ